MEHKKIAVLGSGSWGTALAILLSKNGHDVYLWGNEPQQINKLELERQNQEFLPSILFPHKLQVFSELYSALKEAQLVVIAVPSQAFREVLQTIKPLIGHIEGIIWGTKGLDPETNTCMSEIAKEILESSLLQNAVLAGPSFAKEVALGLPTAVTIASENLDFARAVAVFFHNDYFRPYVTNDVIGAEIGGIIKNILAIAVGISDGVGFGANARAALITRGLAEMVRLGTTLGGRQETFYGLSGIGDLILTATDNQSRNRRFGLALGQGTSIKDAMKEIGQIVEGAHNASQIYKLMQKHQLQMPICEQVYKVLHENLPAHTAAKNLLQRTLKDEK
jgi:glycerol-3-phosphate dehydrogenase (NAD(P)+)